MTVVVPPVLEVNWSGDGSTWVDETGYRMTCEWTRGRDYASQLTGRAAAGTLRADLLNVGGRFAPFYAAGPLFGSLRPGRKVRVRTPNVMTNPSVEDTDITMFAAYTASTRTRVLTEQHSGVASLKVDVVDDVNNNGVVCYPATTVPGYPSGTTLTASAWVKGTNGQAFLYGARWRNASTDTHISEDLGTAGTFTGAWQRISVTRTPTPGVAFDLGIQITSQLTATFYVDDIQIEKNPAATDYATTRVLWQGFLDAIAPDPGSRDSAPTCVLAASGPLRWVADRKASTGVSTSIATGTAVGIVLDDAGWPAGDRTIDTGQIVMTRWRADGDNALTALRQLEETEFGFLSESADGKIVFEDVFHRLTSPHTSPVASFSDAAGAALPYDAIEEIDPWREIYNRFEADIVLFSVQASATLWSLVGEVPSIPPGQTREFWAMYPTPDAATQADHVDAWTSPVATTDYIANAASDGSGANLTASMTVVPTKFANAMKIAITNTTAVVAYLTLLQARGTPVYKNDPIRVVSEDATSAAAYGKHTFPLPGKFYPSTARGLSFTQYGLSRYKDPLPTLAMTFDATMDAAHMEQALARDISDRITVRADDTTAAGAQLGINEDFFVEAMTHRYDLSGHSVTLQLSSAKGDGGYWNIGISTLGITTKLAP